MVAKFFREASGLSSMREMTAARVLNGERLFMKYMGFINEESYIQLVKAGFEFPEGLQHIAGIYEFIDGQNLGTQGPPVGLKGWSKGSSLAYLFFEDEDLMRGRLACFAAQIVLIHLRLFSRGVQLRSLDMRNIVLDKSAKFSFKGCICEQLRVVDLVDVEAVVVEEIPLRLTEAMSDLRMVYDKKKLQVTQELVDLLVQVLQKVDGIDEVAFEFLRKKMAEQRNPWLLDLYMKLRFSYRVALNGGSLLSNMPI